MIYIYTVTTISTICAISALILAIYGIIIIKAMERSTHTVTWQPIENDEMDLIARKNEEFNKKIKQDVELEDLGY